MTTTQRSRMFQSGEAKTLYLTIPARVATDSAFPFEPDDPVRVSIESGELRVTADREGRR